MIDVILDVDMEVVFIDKVCVLFLKFVLYGDEEKMEFVDFIIGLGEGVVIGFVLMVWLDLLDLMIDLEVSSLLLGDFGILLNIDF